MTDLHAHPILEGDATSAWMGLHVELAEKDHAVVRMTVREEMVNGFGITHGGLVFALADTAFAYACNEDDRVTVASGADITFARASHVGTRLTATAERRWRSGRNGLYDVRIADESGAVVAEFRGRSFTTDRPLPEVPGLEAAGLAVDDTPVDT